MAVLGPRCCLAFSLAAESWGCSLVVMARASHCGGLLLSTGWMVVMHELSCSVACRILLDQGLNLYLLHWQMDSLPLSHCESESPSVLSDSSGPEYWSG